MRLAGWFTVAMLAVAPAAAAQGVQGPLGDPDPSQGAAPSSRPAKAARHLHGHATKSASKAATRAATKAATRSAAAPADIMRDPAAPEAPPPSAPPPSAPPTSRAEHAAAPTASDPVSLGFKWQGNNDTAEKTRVQNYNGDATGTGAALGLNLHF